MKRGNWFTFFLSMLLVVFFLPAPASAYLDPSTGSYAIQALFATIFAFLFHLKSAWQAISQKFASKKQDKMDVAAELMNSGEIRISW